MKFSVQILPSARKSLAAIPERDRARIDARILSLADNPRPPGAAPLKGLARRVWRLRAGNYRILYEIQDQQLIVLVIDAGHRREIYRGL
jgi:mRNA interferase RelE/StbE